MLGAAALSLSACSGGGGETVTLTGSSTIGPIAEVTARDSNVDAVSVVHNVETDFVTDLTMDELAEIWSADSDVTTWSDVRSEWPDDEISLFGLDPATHLLFPAG